MASSTTFSTTKVTVTACVRFLEAYKKNVDKVMNVAPYCNGQNPQLIKSLVSQMEEIVGSGVDKSLNEPKPNCFLPDRYFSYCEES